ncbi:MAG: glycosyltransferase family 4 protein [Stenomitos rutilans HA7619-LM2]|jgi:glycosyltransferase involved in cell wall biosynthesis|nr:glycosyltransferase family 4 protein [Stenomitos rutilans HA7619-LM2]
MIRVAYDASVLGMGYLNPKARTGIFRMVEALLLELVAHSNLEIKVISFDSESTFWDNIGTSLYIKNLYPSLAKNFQSVYSSRFNLYALYTHVVTWQRSLIKASTPDRIWLYKSARAMQILFEKVARLDMEAQFHSASFDLYHSLYYPLPSRAITGNISRILTVHDLIPVLFPQFVIPRVYQRCVATLNSIDRDRDWIICNSQYTKQDFCEYTGMDGDRVFVTPLAAADFFQPVTDTALIASTLQRHQIPNYPYLLSLATLEPRKNLGFLIRCFSQIIQDAPALDLNLVLVGVSGWQTAEIFQAARHNPQLRSRIIFTGYLPDRDLSAIYSGATAFVYPSLYEGFGLPPLEAMQCGTPVITASTSSLPEVVGDAGILIDPTQEDDLCQAILNVMHDAQRRADLSQRATQRASQFSWASCAQQTAEIYQTAAANSSQ